MNDAEIAQVVDKILSQYTEPKAETEATPLVSDAKKDAPKTAAFDLTSIVSRALADTLNASSYPKD